MNIMVNHAALGHGDLICVRVQDEEMSFVVELGEEEARNLVAQLHKELGRIPPIKEPTHE